MNTINDIKLFYKNIFSKKGYYLPLLLFCFVAFGFSIFNRTVSMDDLSYSMFAGENHMAIGGYRWGLYLLNLFLYTKEYTPFIGRFFALVFLIADAALLSLIVYSTDGKSKNICRYLFLSIMFCTYPLINELWYCTGLSVPIQYNGVSFYFLFVFVSIIYQIYNREFSIKNILISGVLVTPAVAGYESVIFAYVTTVLIVLYLTNSNKKEKYNWFVDGLRYATPLFVGLILKYLIGYILILLVKPTGAGAGGTSVMWLSKGFAYGIKEFVFNGWYYIIRALTYFPIGEFVVALLAFVIICVKNQVKGTKDNIILGVFIVLSLFFLSLVQGEYLHYRTAQTIEVFMAFVVYLVIKEAENHKYMNIIVVVLLSTVALRQSVYTHELLALNNQRSENEAYIARTIGYKLYSEFDISKTVVFCGEYQLGSFIEDQIIVDNNSLGGKAEAYIRELLGHDLEREYDEFVCTNIDSYFNKQMDAFNGQIMIKKYMSYYGFDLNVLENLSDKEEDKLKGYYEKIAKENNMKPYEIKDMGDYILVYLGPTIDGVSKLKYK